MTLNVDDLASTTLSAVYADQVSVPTPLVANPSSELSSLEMESAEKLFSSLNRPLTEESKNAFLNNDDVKVILSMFDNEIITASTALKIGSSSGSEKYEVNIGGVNAGEPLLIDRSLLIKVLEYTQAEAERLPNPNLTSQSLNSDLNTAIQGLESMQASELMLPGFEQLAEAITVEDINRVADAYGITLREGEAKQLNAALTDLTQEDLANHEHRELLLDSMTTEIATVGALVGGGIGYVVAGPVGAVAGAGIGASLGADIGLSTQLDAQTEDSPEFWLPGAEAFESFNADIVGGTASSTLYGYSELPKFNNTTGGVAAQNFYSQFGTKPADTVRATRADLGLKDDDTLIIDVGGEGQKEDSELGFNTGNTHAINLNWETNISPGNFDVTVEPGDHEMVTAADNMPISNLVRPSSSWSTNPSYPFADNTANGMMLQGSPLTDKNIEEIARVVSPHGWILLTVNSDYEENGAVKTLAEKHNGSGAYTKIPSGSGNMDTIIIPPSSKVSVDVSGVTAAGFYDFVAKQQLDVADL